MKIATIDGIEDLEKKYRIEPEIINEYFAITPYLYRVVDETFVSSDKFTLTHIPTGLKASPAHRDKLRLKKFAKRLTEELLVDCWSLTNHPLPNEVQLAKEIWESL